ncbi:MAG: serine hydrolase [Deltaproteobacteria bacterium]|nr:serine hydrolase [Deltaproteobacteria bacterium]
MSDFLKLAILSLSVIVETGARAECPERVEWPDPDFTSETASVAAGRAAEITALEDFAFTLVGEDPERKGARTDALIIARRGRIIYERYARGFRADLRHQWWSVTKSVTNALAGRAVALERVAIADSICKHRSDLERSACPITLKDLLEFGSGIDWAEVYEGKSNQESSVLAMLYGEGHEDMAAFVARQGIAHPPGRRFAYSTGDSTLLAGVLHSALSSSVGPDWPAELLFKPIGMQSAIIERDAAGTPVGGSYLVATPRDLLRFGYLFARDGCWNGQRLLPEGWVADSTAVSDTFRGSAGPLLPDEVQGRQFWLNQSVPEQGIEVVWPSAPTETFAALGHWGQSVTIIPPLELVIVRAADDREPEVFDFDRFLALAMAVAR